MKQERTIGEKVRYYRNMRGYSQEELAEISGISRGQISNVEVGKCIPTDPTLAKLEDALGLPYMTLQGPGKDKKMGETVELIISELKLDLLRRELSEKSIRLVSNIAMTVADTLQEYEEKF